MKTTGSQNFIGAARAGALAFITTVSRTAIRRCAAALSLTMILIASASAQNQTPEIRAVTFVVPPFVMKQGDQLTGFSINLGTRWRRG